MGYRSRQYPPAATPRKKKGSALPRSPSSLLRRMLGGNADPSAAAAAATRPGGGGGLGGPPSRESLASGETALTSSTSASAAAGEGEEEEEAGGGGGQLRQPRSGAADAGGDADADADAAASGGPPSLAMTADLRYVDRGTDPTPGLLQYCPPGLGDCFARYSRHSPLDRTLRWGATAASRGAYEAAQAGRYERLGSFSSHLPTHPDPDSAPGVELRQPPRPGRSPAQEGCVVRFQSRVRHGRGCRRRELRRARALLRRGDGPDEAGPAQGDRGAPVPEGGGGGRRPGGRADAATPPPPPTTATTCATGASSTTCAILPTGPTGPDRSGV